MDENREAYDDRIYSVLKEHYKERFQISVPYNNATQKWLLISTVAAVAIMIVAIALVRLVDSNATLNRAFAWIAVATFFVFSISYITYGILYFLAEIRSLSSPTTLYMEPMKKRVRKENEVIKELEGFEASGLFRVHRRLVYEKNSQNAWLTFVLGTGAKLGLIPAVAAVYAMYTGLLAEELPHNIDVYILTIVTGLSIGSALSDAVMLKIDSMIYVLREAIELRAGVELITTADTM